MIADLLRHPRAPSNPRSLRVEWDTKKSCDSPLTC